MIVILVIIDVCVDDNFCDPNYVHKELGPRVFVSITSGRNIGFNTSAGSFGFKERKKVVR